MHTNIVKLLAFRLLGSAGLVLLVGAMVGCTSCSPAPEKAVSPEYTYLIGPLDTLHIIVWRNQELSMTVPVRPDGKVSVPLVEDLPALGKNSTQVARDIERALGKFIRDPVVTVLVTSFVGPYSEQIRVVGEAAKPQSLSYRQKMTLLDVMIAVGGLTDFAAGNSATILRGGARGTQYSGPPNDLVRRGPGSANVEMKPVDIP